MATKSVKTGAKNEVRSMSKSPLFWLHSYNKSVKKNNGVIDGVNVNLRTLWSRANKVTCNKGFTFALLPQNSDGVICKYIKVTAKNYKGGEIISNCVGDFELIPIGNDYKTTLIDAIDSYLNMHDDMQSYYNSVFFGCKTTECGEIITVKRYTKLEIAKMYANGQITQNEFIEMSKFAA